jgi:hypothetical protein
MYEDILPLIADLREARETYLTVLNKAEAAKEAWQAAEKLVTDARFAMQNISGDLSEKIYEPVDRLIFENERSKLACR